jgi:hypothetical protein
VYSVKLIPRERRLSKVIAEGTKNFSPVYSAWFGKPVVMLVLIRQCHVPMPCRIVGESAADVRVRIQPGWEMDVRKNLILAVEESVIAAEDRGEWKRLPRASTAPPVVRLSVGALEIGVEDSATKTLAFPSGLKA